MTSKGRNYGNNNPPEDLGLVHYTQRKYKGMYRLILDFSSTDGENILKAVKDSDGTFPSSLKELRNKAIAIVEKQAICKLLEKYNWNRKKAAKKAKVSYKTFLNKIKEYEIGKEDSALS